MGTICAVTEKKHLKNWEQNWLEGNISSQEAKKFANEDSEFDLLNRFVNGAKNLRVPAGQSEDQAWQLIENKISESTSTKVISISRRNWIVGIAASLALAIGAFFILDQNTNQITIETSLAEVQTVDLPDGSIVYLNAESSITYSEETWAEARDIELSGEAFFEVKKGNRFVVSTNNGSVEVLGTSFNVRSRNKLLQVACKTGKVKVYSIEKNSEQIITSGSSVSAINGKVSEPVETRLDRIDSWRNGQYDYESLPLQQILNEVKRIYNVEIEHDFSTNELTSPITTTFSSLKDAAQTIAVQKGRDFEADQKKISFMVKTN